ncbi:HAD-IA family hydrolase [Risungbinella massiliensis]|uniref:HAD-IA family hydrolase n=1 Tax=Risungbinella massiliensis TaxID=1329796 RepID=UPI00069C6ABE|nr:HAD-IA family hydrolase [Risungbinella massiliensis]
MRILWDFDGTIMDTYPTMIQAAIRAIEEQGKTISSEELLRRMKRSSVYAFTSLDLDPTETLQKMVEIEQTLPNQQKQPFSYIREVLKLAECNVIYTHKSRKLVEELLDEYQLNEYFTEVVCQEDGFARKPDTPAYEYLQAKYGINLVIGDRELDLEPARKLGIQTCAFQNEEIEADYHLSSYVEFPLVLLGETYGVIPNSKTSPILSTEWLQTYFSPTDMRYQHILGVVQKANKSPESYLHDVGYSPSLIRTGFHPIDGAIYALEHGFELDVIMAILFHGGADGEAQLHGGKIREMYEKLSKFVTTSQQERIDFLTYCDIHTSPDGQTITIEERLADIWSRYNVETVVYQNMKQQVPYLMKLRKKYAHDTFSKD